MTKTLAERLSGLSVGGIYIHSTHPDEASFLCLEHGDELIGIVPEDLLAFARAVVQRAEETNEEEKEGGG